MLIRVILTLLIVAGLAGPMAAQDDAVAPERLRAAGKAVQKVWEEICPDHFLRARSLLEGTVTPAEYGAGKRKFVDPLVRGPLLVPRSGDPLDWFRRPDDPWEVVAHRPVRDLARDAAFTTDGEDWAPADEAAEVALVHALLWDGVRGQFEDAWRTTTYSLRQGRLPTSQKLGKHYGLVLLGACIQDRAPDISAAHPLREASDNACVLDWHRSFLSFVTASRRPSHRPASNEIKEAVVAVDFHFRRERDGCHV